MILAKTLKGKGISFTEDKEGWHGKALKKGEELDRALAELEGAVHRERRRRRPRFRSRRRRARVPICTRSRRRRSRRRPTSSVKASRRAKPMASALARLGAVDTRARRARRRRRQLDLQRALREGVPRSLLSGVHRRTGDGRRGDGPRQPRRDCVPVDVRLLPEPRLRLHPHGRHQHAERQAGRLARRRLDRRRRPVADGARGSGDDARRAELRRALSLRRGQHRAADRVDGLSPWPGLHAHVAAEDAGDLRTRRAVPDRRLQGAAIERGRSRDARRRRRHALRGAEGARSAEGRRASRRASSISTACSRSTRRRCRRPGRRRA